MKSLSLFAAIPMLLASCQPSSDNTAATETRTQQKPAAVVTESRTIESETRHMSAYRAAASDKMSPKDRAFSKFLKGFPDAALPLTLNSKTAKSINNKQFISYDYERFIPEMAGERFSREVGKEYYYFAKVSEGEDYITVVYAVKNVMMGDNAPYGYVIASYNGKGKLIDKLVAGGQIELDEALRVGSISPSLDIEVKEFTQKWAKNPAEEGYYDNKVVASSLKRTKQYHIAEDGFIKRTAVEVAMR